MSMSVFLSIDFTLVPFVTHCTRISARKENWRKEGMELHPWLPITIIIVESIQKYYFSLGVDREETSRTSWTGWVEEYN